MAQSGIAEENGSILDAGGFSGCWFTPAFSRLFVISGEARTRGDIGFIAAGAAELMKQYPGHGPRVAAKDGHI